MSILVETELLTLEKFVKFDDAKADLKTKRKKSQQMFLQNKIHGCL